MDDFFVSDLAMLGEEEDDALGEFSDNLDLLNDVNNMPTLQNFLQNYVDQINKFDDAQVCELPDDKQFQLVGDASALSVDIEDNIVSQYNIIRDRYRLKFPELESLVQHPVDYARVVKMIGNETDMTRVLRLKDLLSPAMIMVVSVTASTTSGTPLPQDLLDRTLEACDRVIELDSMRTKLINFVETRMSHIAPNLSALVGSAVAAKLMAAAGSLEKLANIAACDIQVLGAQKKILAGFSSQLRVGFIEQTEVFQSTPPSLRNNMSRILAAKAALATRVDFARGDTTGEYGRKLLEEVRKKVVKLQGPSVAMIQKALPAPNDFSTKKKRGGKRLRKTKERYEVTEMRKLANRVKFNVTEESSLGDGLGIGYGMLGRDGCGKLRVPAAPTKLKLSKAHKKMAASYVKRNASEISSMCLAITPVQGIEFQNLQADANQLGSGMQSIYFSKTAAFSKTKSNP